MIFSTRLALFWAAVMLLLAGCAGKAPLPPPLAVPTSLAQDSHTADNGWWYARFQMDWPEDLEPAWHIDTLLAHRVAAPALHQYQDNIKLWRFHRRAARDGGGHQFSFIFFTDPATARQVIAQLESSAALGQLIQTGKVRKVSFDDTTQVIRPKISSTSDSNWPENIQNAWPSFIMGASQMWLDLIEAIAAEHKTDNQDTEVLYEKVQNTLTGLWNAHGQHAMFHHLSALYSYQPLLVIDRRSMQF